MRFNDIKEFDIYNVLGKGSFATVFRAVPKMGCQEIDKKIMKAKNMVPRVRNEVELHSRLKHPSILELYSYFEDKNFVYLVLELCQIGELGAFIMNNKISNKGILEQKAQIIEGVLYLHQHSIVHRDLTISNILLDKNLYVKIADFGLAIHLTKPDEKHYTMCGTPNFISPETVSNTAHGMQVDIWSLGCILYTMLCGTPPFDTQTIETTFSKIVTGKFTIPPYLSSDAYDLIVKFLQNDPKSRIKLTDALKHPFIRKYHTVSSSCNGNIDESSIMIFGDKPNCQNNGVESKNNFDNRENFYTPKNQFAIPCEDSDIYRGRNKKISCPPKLSVLEETTDYSSRGDEDNQLLTNVFSSKTHPLNSQDRSNSPENFIHNLRNQLTSLNLKLAERKNSTYGTKSLPQNINDRPRLNINDENNNYESKISNRIKENAINKRLFSNSNFPFTDVTNNNNNTTDLAKIIEKCPHPYNHKDFKGPIKANNTPKKKRDESTLRDSTNKRRRKQEEITKEKLENFVAGPLNTARLKPFKQKNGDVIMSILPGGDVSLEYYTTTTRPPKNSIYNFDNDQKNHRNYSKPPSQQQTAILRQIFKVSHDGLKIEIYDALDNIRNTGLTLCQNNNYNNQNSNDLNTMYSERITDVYNENNTIYTPANGRPPLPNTDRGFKIYAFDNLPRPYWKKYGLASRFVKIVRMKTPKVTVYTHDAKCHLMENSPNPDFEALFYDGPKFVISNNKIPQNSAYPTEKDDFHTLKIKHLNMESKIVKDISYYAPYLNKNGKMAHNLKDSAMNAPNGQKIDRDILQNLAKAFDYREYCFQVEKSLESLTTDPTTSTIYISSTNNTSPFPIVVGTNPKRLLTYNPLNQMPLGENNNDNKVSHVDKKEISTFKSEKNPHCTLDEKEEALKNSRNHDGFYSKRDRIASDRYDDQNYTQGTNRISKNSQTPSHHQKYPNETLMTSFDEISPQSNNLISAYVPGNCWGLYDPRTKKITAKFLDGIQLVIDADHLNRIKYIDTNNSANEDYYKNLSYVSHDLTINPNLPDHIKDKLNVIPLLVQNIKANCTKV